MSVRSRPVRAAVAVPWRWTALFAALGALPSVMWAFSHPSLIHDDWALAAEVRFHGVWWSIGHMATAAPARPLMAVYAGLAYGLFGAHPVPHALAMAALNAVAAGLLFALIRRLGSHRLAVAATIAWVVLPNRATSHYWLVTAPNVLAVCLLLAGALLLSTDRRRVAALAFAAGAVTYEGTVVLAVAAIAAWWWHDRHKPGRFRSAAAMLAPIGAGAAFVWLHSPKRVAALHPFTRPGDWLSAHFGAGVFGSSRAGVIVGAAVLVAVGVAIARRDRAAGTGLAVLVLGVLPFAATGFPAATSGLFDRGNVIADLGTAILLGATALFVIDRAPRAFAAGAIAVALAATVGPNLAALHNYTSAAASGRHLGAQLAADIATIDRPLVVGPPLPAPGGVAALLTSWDLSAYLQLARHDPAIEARMACTDGDFAVAREALRYDRVTRTLEHRSTTWFGSATCTALGL